MTLQFGPTKIGAMQYNGVTIGEAMYNGQIVYRSVVTVTPQAPTFLTASPWVTLPTQAGVTYTVSGTPGYGQSVTVTATPQAGYELAGQTSWTHTYGQAPSIYPVSGTWNSALTSSATTYADHTIAEDGSYTLTHTVTGGGQYVTAAIAGPPGGINGPVGPPSTVTTTQTLAAGDVIQFQAVSFFPSGTASGSWSITKEALTVITVTPQAPTFLTESPWYTLPTQEGVTYSITGTPGYDASVTVTATAQAGYELVGQTSWTHTYGPPPGPPVVHITGQGGLGDYTSRDQFRQACIDYGTTYDTVVELPFLLDTSQAVGMVDLFAGCSALTTVPAMDTSNVIFMYRMFASCSSLTYVPDLQAGNVTNVRFMFVNCASLTDGNVRLIGKHPSVITGDMIRSSGLTRLPFFNAAGQPI